MEMGLHHELFTYQGLVRLMVERMTLPCRLLSASQARQRSMDCRTSYRLNLCAFASLREIFLFFYSRLFVCIRGRFLFIDRNRGSGFARVEDDKLDRLIGGEPTVNCTDGLTQSLTCSDGYVLVCSLFLYG
jgi:hypothetical protein